MKNNILKNTFLTILTLLSVFAFAQSSSGTFVVNIETPQLKDAFVGGKINYTISITNVSNSTIKNIFISCPILSLDNKKIEMPIPVQKGSTKFVSGSYQYTITAQDLQNEEVTALFTVTTTNNNSPVTASTSVTTPIKSIKANPDNYFISGTYGTIFNKPNVLENDTIFNTIPNNEDKPDNNNVTLSILSSSSPQISIDQNGYLSVPENLPSGTYSIEYQICYSSPVSKCSSAKVTINIENIKINQSVKKNDSTKEGDKITFLFTIENTGKQSISNIKISNPAIGLDKSPVKDSNFNDIIIPAGSSYTHSVTYTVTKNDADKGFIQSNAFVTASGPLDAYSLYADDNKIIPIGNIIANNDIFLDIEKTSLIELSPDDIFKNDFINSTTPIDANKITPTQTDDVYIKKLSVFRDNIEIDPASVDMDARGYIKFKNAPAGLYKINYQICKKTSEENLCAQAFIQVPIVESKVDIKSNATQPKNIKAGDKIVFNYTIRNIGTSTFKKVIFAGSPLQNEIVPSAQFSLSKNHIVTAEEEAKQQIVNQENVRIETSSGKIIDTKTNPIVLIPLPDINPNEPKKNYKNAACAEKNPEDECKIVIYNTITVNDDNKNDSLFICGIECYPDNTVDIYDQLGTLVFHINYYNNSKRNFRGFSNTGVHINTYNRLSGGTYFCSLQYKDMDGNYNSLAQWIYLIS